MQKEIDTIIDLLKVEKPEEVTLFINWFKYMFQDNQELVEEVKGIKEVKSMLRTSIKKLAQEAERDGMQKGIEKGIQKGIQKQKLETAKILLKEKMPVKKIAQITGMEVEEIEKIKK